MKIQNIRRHYEVNIWNDKWHY